MNNRIGDMLDALGVQAELDEGELICSAVVLMETVGEDGETSLQIVEDDSTSWVKKIGMLKVALDVALAECGRRHEHDDTD